MNKRHIHTFLTVSAAFFAMSAPLHSDAAARMPATAVARSAQHAVTTKEGTSEQRGADSERDA